MSRRRHRFRVYGRGARRRAGVRCLLRRGFFDLARLSFMGRSGPGQVSMSRAEPSSTEKSTAIMVASLPIRKSASLAILISSALGDPKAEETTTSRARFSL
jgi:hypothetical protein